MREYRHVFIKIPQEIIADFAEGPSEDSANKLSELIVQNLNEMAAGNWIPLTPFSLPTIYFYRDREN